MTTNALEAVNYLHHLTLYLLEYTQINVTVVVILVKKMHMCLSLVWLQT